MVTSMEGDLQCAARLGKPELKAGKPKDKDQQADVTVIATETPKPLLVKLIGRHAALNRIIDNAARNTKDILSRHSPKATLDVQRGLATELHHEATFNIDSVRQGALFRAELVPGQAAADIRILDTTTRSTVGEVQVKSYKNPKDLSRALRRPDYAGMQKVCPADVPVRAATDRMTHGPVSSAPLTTKEGEALVRDPAAHFDAYRPNTAAESLRAGVTGAAMGGVLGAGLAATSTLAHKGVAWDSKDVEAVAEVAALSTAAGGVGSAVSVAAGSTVLGGMAGGMVGTGYSMWRAPDRKSAVTEGVVGTTAMAAGTIAAAAVSMLPLGPLNFISVPAAAWLARSRARRLAAAAMESLDAGRAAVSAEAAALQGGAGRADEGAKTVINASTATLRSEMGLADKGAVRLDSHLGAAPLHTAAGAGAALARPGGLAVESAARAVRAAPWWPVGNPAWAAATVRGAGAIGQGVRGWAAKGGGGQGVSGGPGGSGAACVVRRGVGAGAKRHAEQAGSASVHAASAGWAAGRQQPLAASGNTRSKL